MAFNVHFGIDFGGKSAEKETSSDVSSGTNASGTSVSAADLSESSASHSSTESVSRRPSQEEKGTVTGTPRRLYVMRHAERLDRIFPAWLRLAFSTGEYRSYDLNQPPVLPPRPAADYHNDPPITELGKVTAQMVGRGLRKADVHLQAVYCSPALRCVQTAASLLKLLGGDAGQLRVEPGLFEWMGWYDKPPRWMTAAELISAGYPVDLQYAPVVSVEQMLRARAESRDDYYRRTHELINKLANSSGAVLIVAHGTTVDAACRPLIGKPQLAPTRWQLDRIGLRYPYCSTVTLEQMPDSRWRVVDNALPAITFLGFDSHIDAKYLLRD